MEAIKLDNYSYEDYLEIDKNSKDEERVELIFGEIYMMSGASAMHQDIVLNISSYLKSKQKDKRCKVRIAPYDVKLKNRDDISVVQPDIMLFCDDKQKPCAVFEVLSPSTASKDKGIKKSLYEISKIKEYYIIDGDLKIVDKYILENGKYYYEKGYSLGEVMEIGCANVEVLIDDIFDI